MTSATKHDRQGRAAQNQSLFREVNEQVEQLQDQSRAPEDIDFCCECADTTCSQLMTLTRDEYEAVRSEPSRFAVVPTHVYPDVEEVVARNDRYWTVVKIEEAATVAAALDPRAVSEDGP